MMSTNSNSKKRNRDAEEEEDDAEDCNEEEKDQDIGRGEDGKDAEKDENRDKDDLVVDNIFKVDYHTSRDELFSATSFISSFINDYHEDGHENEIVPSEAKALLMIAKFDAVLSEVKSLRVDSSSKRKSSTDNRQQAKIDKAEALSKTKQAKEKLDNLCSDIKKVYSDVELFDKDYLIVKVALMREHDDYHKFEALTSGDKAIRKSAKSELFNGKVTAIRRCLSRLHTYGLRKWKKLRALLYDPKKPKQLKKRKITESTPSHVASIASNSITVTPAAAIPLSNTSVVASTCVVSLTIPTAEGLTECTKKAVGSETIAVEVKPDGLLSKVANNEVTTKGLVSETTKEGEKEAEWNELEAKQRVTSSIAGSEARVNQTFARSTSYRCGTFSSDMSSRMKKLVDQHGSSAVGPTTYGIGVDVAEVDLGKVQDDNRQESSTRKRHYSTTSMSFQCDQEPERKKVDANTGHDRIPLGEDLVTFSQESDDRTSYGYVPFTIFSFEFDLSIVCVRLGVIYLIVSAYCLNVKIGHSKSSHKLLKRFKTYSGHDMLIYVWDIYYDNRVEGMGWKTIETSIHDFFVNQRIWSDLELFHLFKSDQQDWSYCTRQNNLVDFYRLNITNFILNHTSPFLHVAYKFGITIRRIRAHKQDTGTAGVRGNLVYAKGCEDVYNWQSDDEIGVVNMNNIGDMLGEFYAKFEEVGGSTKMMDKTFEDIENDSRNVFDETPSIHAGPMNSESGANLADQTNVASYSGLYCNQISKSRSSMHGNERIEGITDNYLDKTTPYAYRGRVVVDPDEDNVIIEKVGVGKFPYPRVERDEKLQELGFYRRAIKNPFDDRIDVTTETTVPSFTLLFSDYVRLPDRVKFDSVSFSYRLWREGKNGDESVFEFRVRFANQPSNVVVSPITQQESLVLVKGDPLTQQESLVLVKGDPLNRQKSAKVEMVSFKPRFYLEGIAVLEGLCKVYASSEYPVVLAINKPHSRDGISWDNYECSIIQQLNFKFSTDFCEFQYIILQQSQWHDPTITPSGNLAIPKFRGASITELSVYERAHGIYEVSPTDEETQKLLRLASETTRKNRHDRRKHDGELEDNGSQSQSSESSQESSQAMSQAIDVYEAEGAHDEDDESFIDKDDSEWFDDDDFYPKSNENDDDRDDESMGDNMSASSESDDGGDDGGDDGWKEPPNGTIRQIRTALWIKFYVEKLKYRKVR